MMYLLDTHVVFELRKAKSEQVDAGMLTWAASVPYQNLFLSAVSLLELEASVAVQERKDKTANFALRTWLDEQVARAFDGRILPVDAAVARKRGQISLADSRDALLAATALVHGLIIVTRNVAAYKSSRVKVFNPWGYTPDAVDENGDWRQVAKTGPLWLKNLFLRF